MVVVYAAPEKNLFENPVDFTVGAAGFTSTLPFLWADDITRIRTDRYGNEVLPEQYQLPCAASFLKEYESFSGIPLSFDLPAGEVEITVRPQNQGLLLYGIYAVAPRPDLSYSDLYGEAMFLYGDLLNAHRANDMAVMEAYGFFMEPTPEHPSKWYSPSETVAALMKMYQELTEKNNG